MSYNFLLRAHFYKIMKITQQPGRPAETHLPGGQFEDEVHISSTYGEISNPVRDVGENPKNGRTVASDTANTPCVRVFPPQPRYLTVGLVVPRGTEYNVYERGKRPQLQPSSKRIV